MALGTDFDRFWAPTWSRLGTKIGPRPPKIPPKAHSRAVQNRSTIASYVWSVFCLIFIDLWSILDPKIDFFYFEKPNRNPNWPEPERTGTGPNRSRPKPNRTEPNRGIPDVHVRVLSFCGVGRGRDPPRDSPGRRGGNKNQKRTTNGGGARPSGRGFARPPPFVLHFWFFF